MSAPTPIYRADIWCTWRGVPCAFSVQVVVPEHPQACLATADRARDTARRAALSLLPGATDFVIDVPPWGDGRLTDKTHHQGETPVVAPPREYTPEKPFRPYKPRLKVKRYVGRPDKRLDAIVEKERNG